MINLNTKNSAIMLYVIVAAVFFAALRSPSNAWTEVVFTITVGLFIFAVFQSCNNLSDVRLRRWWSGFGTFGAANLIINGMRMEANLGAKLPTMRFSLAIVHVFFNQAYGNEERYRLYAISNALISLVLGLIGGTIFASLSKQTPSEA